MNPRPAPVSTPRGRGLLIGVLLASVAANAALVRFAFPGDPIDQASASTIDALASADTFAASAAAAAVVASPRPAVAVSSSPTIPNDLWTRLDHADLATWVANLRAAGFSEDDVRLLAWMRIKPPIPSRFVELADTPYWLRNGRRRQAMFRPQTEDTTRQEAAVEQFTALFGSPPGNLEMPGFDQVMSASSGLTPEAMQRLSRAQRGHFQAMNTALAAGGTPEERTQRTAALQQQLQDRIRAELTPAEYADYQRRGSSAAFTILMRAGAFPLTQQEFDGLVTLADALPGMMAISGEGFRNTAQLATVFSPDRLAAFQQVMSLDGTTSRLFTRLGLPLETAVAVDAVRNESRDRVRALQEDRSLDRAQRQREMVALAEEARQRLRAQLSPEAFDAYYETAGSWLDQLTPPAPAGGNPSGP